MKRLGIILVFLSGFLAIAAQNKIQGWEYWFDQNRTAVKKINLSPATQFALNTSVATTSLSDGLHLIHLRFRDDSARFSTPLTGWFYRFSGATVSGSRITGAQYWFDNGFDAATTLTLPQGAAVRYDIAIEPLGVSNGLHLLHIRFRDNTGRWTSPQSHFFYRAGGQAGLTENSINALQYWFNSNVDQAVIEPLGGGATLSLQKAIATASLPEGLNLLHLRFRDGKGHWSPPVSSFAWVGRGILANTNMLSRYQYWFDDSIQHAITRQEGPDTVLLLTGLLDARSLPDGVHRVNLRFADTTGLWSVPISQFFHKLDNAEVNLNVITGYRYWFNNDDASKMVVHKVQGQPLVAVQTAIDMGCLTAGTNRFHMQASDTRGLWSVAVTDTIEVLPPASNIYRFTGNGNWSNASNWLNGNKPAPDLPSCKEIIIDHIPGGVCFLDVSQSILKNAKLTVLPGKHLVLSHSLRVKYN